MEALILIVLFLFVISIPVLVVGNLVWAFGEGMQAWSLSETAQGEHARTLRFLAVNLCEPLINTFVILVCLVTLTGIYRDPVMRAALATLPMAVLLLPGLGTSFRNALYRDISLKIFRLGLARWLITFFTLQMEPFSGLTFLAGLGLLWYSTHWGRRQLKGVLALPKSTSGNASAIPVGIPSQQHVPTQRLNTSPGFARTRTGTTPLRAARTASVPQVVPMNSTSSIPMPLAPGVALPSDPSIPCPVCHAATRRSASECPSCGLVFMSRVPPALRSLPAYEVLRPLGNGGMSSVYLARRKQSSNLCVIKSLLSVDTISDPLWRSEASRCLTKESDLLRHLDHPNIVRVLNTFTTRHGNFLVLEYVPGPTLEERLSRPDGRGGVLPGTALSLKEALRYAVSIAGVLDYLARLPEPVIHHDIKPSNLIVRAEDNRLVLVDFGSAVLLPGDSPKTVHLDCYGTPGYAAPEQYHGQSSPKSDVYGLGATLYHLLTDDDPTAHPLSFPALAALPSDVAAVLHTALMREPTARPDARTLRQWLQSIAYRLA